MTLDEFRALLEKGSPPAELPPLLAALLWDAKGDWDRAHELAQSEGERKNTPESFWMHAYLHRKEGDTSNANYWYRRAMRPAATESFEEEWAQIATALLNQNPRV